MADRRNLLISGAVAVGLAAAVTVYILSLERSYDIGVHPVPVLVATKKIPARSVIAKSDVTQLKLPGRLILDGAVREERGAVGWVAQTTLFPGEQVLKAKIVKPGQGPGLVGAIPSGRRAVTIKLDLDAGLSDSIKPGDKVDVVTVIPEADGATGRAATILQAVPVIAISGGGSDDDGTNPPPLTQPSAVLAVTPSEAQLLALAEETGSLRLTVRRPNDTGVLAVSPSSLNQVMRRPPGVLEPRASGPQPNKIRPVEVIRGVEAPDGSTVEEVQEVFWQSE